MECESWCLVTRDKVHFSFILSPYQALATTCKPAGSGLVESIGGEVHVEGDA